MVQLSHSGQQHKMQAIQQSTMVLQFQQQAILMLTTSPQSGKRQSQLRELQQSMHTQRAKSAVQEHKAYGIRRPSTSAHTQVRKSGLLSATSTAQTASILMLTISHLLTVQLNQQLQHVHSRTSTSIVEMYCQTMSQSSSL